MHLDFGRSLSFNTGIYRISFINSLIRLVQTAVGRGCPRGTSVENSVFGSVRKMSNPLVERTEEKTVSVRRPYCAPAATPIRINSTAGGKPDTYIDSYFPTGVEYGPEFVPS